MTSKAQPKRTPAETVIERSTAFAKALTEAETEERQAKTARLRAARLARAAS